MNKKIKVSAPGKLMLLGEHAVVYKKPCLVTAVDQRIEARVELLDVSEFQLETGNQKVSGYKKKMREIGKGALLKEAQFVEIALRNVLEKYPAKYGFRVKTTSAFSSKFGLGSSSAVTVCVIKSVSQLLNLNLSLKEMFDIAFKTVIDIQGVGSGFDVAAALFGKTIYFKNRGEIIKVLPNTTIPLIIGYSGVKADTAILVKFVGEKRKKYPEIFSSIYNNIEKLVELAKSALIANDWDKLGELMNFNQGYLAALGVSSRKLENMIHSAREGGAYGAKLSGAGGGDCMIALSPDKKRKGVEQMITKSGGEILPIATNAEGARIETE